MDFRKVFDQIPEEFDRWRPRYCPALFSDLIAYAELSPGKRVLEIGPGTGQATEPILQTGCDYHAIELGEHLAAYMTEKFKAYPNFHIVRADFETYDFGSEPFDLVYSAATIQWIPEQIGFSKAYSLLGNGGVFAMMMTKAEYRSTNEPLYQAIQKVYDAHFHPTEHYSCHLEYQNVVNYGFSPLECRHYAAQRRLNADEFARLTATHCDHIVLPEPHRSLFFNGIRNAVTQAGNEIVLNDDVVLYLTRKGR